MADRAMETMSIRTTIPFMLAFCLALVPLLPVGNANMVYLVPNGCLMVVYYWTIHRPALMPPGLAAFIGLLQDLLTGTPIGTNVIVLLTAQAFLANQQKLFIGRVFVWLWLAFAMIAVAAAALSWSLVGIVAGQMIPAVPVVVHGLITILAYPFFSLLFERIDRSLYRRG